MPLLPNPALITTNGAYGLPGLAIFKPHLFTLKGVFAGASVTLQFWDDALGEFTDVDGGTFTATVEKRLITPSSKARLTFANVGGGTRISVTFGPILS